MKKTEKSIKAEDPKKIKVWKRKYIHLVNEENDIKFRGPLSYRHLRIAGWLFLIIAQIAVILSVGASAGIINPNQTLINVMKTAKDLMMPLFLFAAFAQLLVAKNGYKRLLITYGGAALGIFLAFIFVYEHFFIGIMSAIGGGDTNGAHEAGQQFISYLNFNGALSFNIFIDLLLCTLVTFFINYTPTKYFQGKKIYIFRAFVALPIMYEIASILIKILVASQTVTISPFIIPLLTTKPPMAFLIFVAGAIFVKNRERFYIKNGRTYEDYKSFLKTNVNSLHFSIFLVIAILIAVALDITAFIGILVGELAGYNVNDPNFGEYIFYWAQTIYSWGFGQCVIMILLIPIILLFDYKKTYKNNMMDIIIPCAGVILMVLVTVEGMFEVAKFYIIKYLNEAPKEEEPAELAKQVIKQIAEKIRK